MPTCGGTPHDRGALGPAAATDAILAQLVELLRDDNASCGERRTGVDGGLRRHRRLPGTTYELLAMTMRRESVAERL